MSTMTGHTSFVYYVLYLGWAGLSAMFLWLQDVLHRSQIDIPDKYLLLIAVGLSFGTGALSYGVFINESHTPFNKHDFLIQVSLSMFVALLVGLLTSGFVSDTWWLTAVLFAAFFKDVVLTIIRKAGKKKAESVLGLDDK